MNLEVGSTVGDYQVVGILGAGGMGKVYQVRSIISDRVEAMKVLLPDLAHEPELADRFLREIKVQASLEHPNIAVLHSAVRVENQLLMLMEFVEGVTLEQKVKNGPLPVAEAVNYIGQALSALEYAHARGVIHRDIKPANMMLTPGGVVKLMDFGIAKAATDRKLTMTGTTMGSLYYMSPEQIQGASTLDARSDLYSVGVSLYELVTGKRPFDGDSHYAIMAAHLEKTPVPPIELDPRLPPLLNDVILMSVMKDPNTRFQTAAAFRNALSNVPVPLAASPSMIPTVPMGGNPPGIVAQADAAAAAAPRGRRGLWMALGAAAVALAVVGVIEFGPKSGTKAQDGTQVTTIPQTPPQTAPTAPTAPVQEPAAGAQQPVQSAPALGTQTQQASQPHTQPASQAPVESRPGSIAQPGRQGTSQGRLSSSAPPAIDPAPQQTPAQQTTPQSTLPTPSNAAAPPPNAAQQTAASVNLRKELQAAREHFSMLNTRASGIRTTLESIRRDQASKGYNLNSMYQVPASAMDTFLEGAQAAIADNNPEAARRFMDKAELQIDKLEKMLNR